MKRSITLLFLLFLFTTLHAQFGQDSAWIKDNFIKTEQYIPMRDGIRLFTAIYTPKDQSEKHPILITRTPYSCAPYGPDFTPRMWERWRYYARENYIMVVQDVRGRWMSEGEFADVRPFIKNKNSSKDIDEASDTYDTIEWLTKNISNNNGNVGVFGISYPGFYATMAAASHHPALKAVSPQAPVTDWFIGDDFHHNAAFFQLDAFNFYSGFGKPRPQPTTVGSQGYRFTVLDNYKFFLEAGTLKTLARLMGDSIKFWHEMYQHPDYDDWWKARDARRSMFSIKPAMLVVGGLFDAEDCWGAWNLYKAIEKQNPGIHNKIVMGPWYHGQWASTDGTHLGNIRFESNTSTWYQNNIEIPFFHYYLKGQGDDPRLAEATVFFTGENKWRKLEQWPPKEIIPRSIYFSGNGVMTWIRPGSSSSFTEWVSDPSHPVPYTEDVHLRRTREYMTDDQRFASRRPDVMSFQTDPLEADLTLSGPVIADLKASISGTDADFVVKLIDVFPDDHPSPGNYPMGGYQMLVRGEIMRGKYRNSFEKPEPFKPGKIETVKFELPDVAHTFKKGHSLMIQVQNTWFPLADRNPQKFMNIYQSEPNDFQKSTIRLYHDGVNTSAIILPILR
jgi:putative CocE/NonD family hydrolase